MSARSRPSLCKDFFNVIYFSEPSRKCNCVCTIATSISHNHSPFELRTHIIRNYYEFYELIKSHPMRCLVLQFDHFYRCQLKMNLSRTQRKKRRSETAKRQKITKRTHTSCDNSLCFCTIFLFALNRIECVTMKSIRCDIPI